MSRWRIVAWAISAKKLLLTTLPLIIFCQKGNKEVCNVPLFVNPTDSVHYALFKLIVKWHEQISHLEILTSKRRALISTIKMIISYIQCNL